MGPDVQCADDLAAFRFGTMRRIPPRATLTAIKPLAGRCGVTRLADVTGLDTIGIPVFQAIRPLARSISVSQGKGVTRVAARVSALMEAIELHLAEIVTPDAAGSSQAGDCPVEPGRTDIAWCRGTDLLSGRSTRVPHALVSMDYTRRNGAAPTASSNGLASGNDRTEAIVAGLYEVIERDAHSRWLSLNAAARHSYAIDPATITAPVGQRLLRLIRAAGFGFALWSFGQDHGVAAFACAIYELAPAAAAILPPTMGAGAHLDPAIALARAVTEAAQIRVTLIAGSRDDLTTGIYAAPAAQRLRFLIETLGQGRPQGDWTALTSRSSGCLRRDRDHLLASAAAVGARQVACVDIGEASLPIAVVKIIVPGFLGHAQPAVASA